MNNPLNNLKIDIWYKAALAIGVAILLLSLTVELKGIENSTALLLSTGVIFVGSGEWVNHPKTTSIVSPNDKYPGYMQVEKYDRKNTLLGSSFLLAGLIFITYGCYHLYV